jgi:spore maturation protein CgeB
MNKVSCTICESPKVRFWFNKDDHLLYKCQDCRLIFIHPLPEDTTNVYSKDYFCGAEQGRGYINYEEDKKSEKYTFNKYLEEIEVFAPERGRLLDVGAATGSFLEAAKKRGWSVDGVEISDYAAETGRKKNINIVTGILGDSDFPDGSFDVITLWDVFEHVRYPKEDLKKLSKLLKTNGIIALNTPDSRATFARISHKWWPLLLPPEHIHLFSKTGLSNLLEKNDYKVLKTDRIGKKFKPAYILHMMSTVRNKRIWKKLSNLIEKTPLNKIEVPLNLRDNIFLIARKK